MNYKHKSNSANRPKPTPSMTAKRVPIRLNWHMVNAARVHKALGKRCSGRDFIKEFKHCLLEDLVADCEHMITVGNIDKAGIGNQIGQSLA